MIELLCLSSAPTTLVVHVHDMKLVRAVAVSSRAQKASAMVKQPTVPLAVRRKVKRRLEDLQQRGVPAVMLKLVCRDRK